MGLPDVLVTLQGADHPVRQPLTVTLVIEWSDGDFGRAALLTQEAPETVQGAAAHLGPFGAQALGLDVLHRSFQVRLEVELGIRFERQAKHMAGHGDVQLVRDGGTGATADNPLPKPLKERHILGRPDLSGLRARRIGREPAVMTVGQRLIVAFGGSSGWPMGRAHYQPASLPQAA